MTHHSARRGAARPPSLALVATLFLLATGPTVATAQERSFFVDGFLALRGQWTESTTSWLEGGFGRFDSGAADAEASTSALFGQANLGLEWQPSQYFGAYVHLAARSEPSEIHGRAGGVVEAYLHSLFRPRPQDELQLKLGTFFLPTTREAVDRPWTSPYTLTLSALNAWIGEEVRPTGLAAHYDFGLANGDRLQVGGSLFGGNDTTGALLAWRGWALGDRLTVHGEFLPLPPLSSLAPGGGLADQRDEGTRPFGGDLDGRPGWSASLGWAREGRAGISFTHFDNRGDRALHRGEYAWRTDFDHLGAHLELTSNLTLVAEAMQGHTVMGFPPNPKVSADFDAYYLLASWRRGPWRFSVRHDGFGADEEDFSTAENNDDEGRAWTLALLWEPREGWRAGLEWITLDTTRPELATVGLNPRMDAERLVLELRATFGN